MKLKVEDIQQITLNSQKLYQNYSKFQKLI